MKAVFHKKTKACLGLISYCPEGQEGSLVGYAQKDILVKELDEQTLNTIEDNSNPLTYQNLVLSGKSIKLAEEKNKHLLQVRDDIDKLIIEALDESKPIEERFNSLLALVIKKHVRRK